MLHFSLHSSYRAPQVFFRFNWFSLSFFFSLSLSLSLSLSFSLLLRLHSILKPTVSPFLTDAIYFSHSPPPEAFRSCPFLPPRDNRERSGAVPNSSHLPFKSLLVSLEPRFLRILNPVANCDPTRRDRNGEITPRAPLVNKWSPDLAGAIVLINRQVLTRRPGRYRLPVCGRVIKSLLRYARVILPFFISRTAE